jgi:hypothetical protein
MILDRLRITFAFNLCVQQMRKDHAAADEVRYRAF